MFEYCLNKKINNDDNNNNNNNNNNKFSQKKTFFTFHTYAKFYFFWQLLEDYKKEVESQKVFYFLLDMGKRELKWQKSQGNKLSPSNRLSSFVHLYVLSKVVKEVINRRNDPHTCWAISAIVSCAPEKFQVSSRVFEPMSSVMPVQCSNEWSYESTQM